MSMAAVDRENVVPARAEPARARLRACTALASAFFLACAAHGLASMRPSPRQHSFRHKLPYHRRYRCVRRLAQACSRLLELDWKKPRLLVPATERPALWRMLLRLRLLIAAACALLRLLCWCWCLERLQLQVSQAPWLDMEKENEQGPLHLQEGPAAGWLGFWFEMEDI